MMWITCSGKLTAGIVLAASLVAAEGWAADDTPMCIRQINGELIAVPGQCPEMMDDASVQPRAPARTQQAPLSQVKTRVRQIADSRDEQWSLSQFESIVSLGGAAVPTLIALFQDADEDVNVRWVSGRALGRISCAAAAEALARGLRSPVPMVRIAGVRGLMDQGARGAIGPLTRALDDDAAFVRAAALDAIGRLGTSEQVSVVVAELVAPRNFHKGKGLFVRVHAVRALGNLGGSQSIEALVRVADDLDVDTRDAAREALLKLSGRSTVPSGAGTVGQRWERWWSAGRTQPVSGGI